LKRMKETPKLQDMGNNKLFSLFSEYMKKRIAEDMEKIYGKEFGILKDAEPWIFEQKK